MLQVLCSAGVNLDEDLDEADPRCQPAVSGLPNVLESDGEKDVHLPQIQPSLSSAEPIGYRRNTHTAARLPDATTEIVPSKAEQVCTVPGDTAKLVDLTTAIPGAEEDQDNCTVYPLSLPLRFLFRFPTSPPLTPKFLKFETAPNSVWNSA